MLTNVGYNYNGGLLDSLYNATTDSGNMGHQDFLNLEKANNATQRKGIIDYMKYDMNEDYNRGFYDPYEAEKVELDSDTARQIILNGSANDLSEAERLQRMGLLTEQDAKELLSVSTRRKDSEKIKSIAIQSGLLDEQTINKQKRIDAWSF